jgi:hypothetical protein
MASISADIVTGATLAKCLKLTGKNNYTEWFKIMQSNLITAGCWDIVNGDEKASARPNSFYTSRNRPTGVTTLRHAKAEYNRRVKGKEGKECLSSLSVSFFPPSPDNLLHRHSHSLSYC